MMGITDTTEVAGYGRLEYALLDTLRHTEIVEVD